MTERVKKWPEGPWELSGWTVYADSAKRPDGNAQGAICVLVTGSETAWNDVATGRLIAQAPALVEALEQVVFDWDNVDSDWQHKHTELIEETIKPLLDAVYGEESAT